MKTPSFDVWQIVFLVAAAQAFLVGFLLWRWRNGRRVGNRLLAVLMLLFGITLIEYVLYWTGYLVKFPHFANLTMQFPLLFGVLIFLYFREIFEQKPPRLKVDFWHFLPFALATVLMFPYFFQDAEWKTNVLLGKVIERKLPRWFGLFYETSTWLRVASLFGYAIFNFFYLKKQARAGETARWAAWLNWFLLGFAAAYASYFVLVNFPFFNRTWDYHISAAMTAFVYLIAYFGFVQPAVFQGFKLDEPHGFEKYKNSNLTPAAANSLAQRLADLMHCEQLFLEPELRLDDLARRLDASKHHVSQVINEQLGLSFFEYVNSLRIEAARQMLARTSKSEKNIIEIAYAVGFNNKVSFNNTFKKLTGLTPTEFRNRAASVPFEINSRAETG